MTALLIAATVGSVSLAALLGHRWGADVGAGTLGALAILLVPAWLAWVS